MDGKLPAENDKASDQREQLISAFQTQAMKQADPLRANLAVINGDLMQIAYRTRQALDKEWTKNRDDLVAEKSEMILRRVRAIDRLARFDRDLGAKPAATD